jgi:hypothetical protein
VRQRRARSPSTEADRRVEGRLRVAQRVREEVLPAHEEVLPVQGSLDRVGSRTVDGLVVDGKAAGSSTVTIDSTSSDRTTPSGRGSVSASVSGLDTRLRIRGMTPTTATRITTAIRTTRIRTPILIRTRTATSTRTRIRTRTPTAIQTRTRMAGIRMAIQTAIPTRLTDRRERLQQDQWAYSRGRLELKQLLMRRALRGQRTAQAA